MDGDHDDRGDPVAKIPDGWVALSVREDGPAYFNTRDISVVRRHGGGGALVETTAGTQLKVTETAVVVVEMITAAIERLPRRRIARDKAKDLD